MKENNSFMEKKRGMMNQCNSLNSSDDVFFFNPGKKDRHRRLPACRKDITMTYQALDLQKQFSVQMDRLGYLFFRGG